jgi:prepilin-type processing-associated H-X9-DG protein
MRTKSAALFTLATAGAGLFAAQAAASAPAAASTAQQTFQLSANAAATAVKLPDGLYVDGRDGVPHYVLSLAASRRGGIRGSANFLYQDGRVAFTGEYNGTISGNGRLSIRFYEGTIRDGKIVLHGRGKVLTGTYQKDSLHLNGCAAVLPWVKKSPKHLSCTFTYNRYVP